MFFFLFGLVISGADVYVMAPLDMLNENQEFNYKDKLFGWFDTIAAGNVDGVMLDVWWGLAETSSKNYKWTGYNELFTQLKNRGLKIVPVMSFHRCGGNVGDQCDIPLPSFITNADPSPFFKDQDGNVDQEYISFSFDNEVVNGRTPIQMYKDFMDSFKTQFSSFLNDGTITEIEVGLGPCGEMRYPSYQSWLGWNYPGCGGFQTFDDKFVDLLEEDAQNAGVPEYGHNPTNVGNFNLQPEQSDFWREYTSDGWKSDYGQWYIKWYSQKLIDHGGRVMNVAREVFPSTKLSAKIAGLHWWYMNYCHCAETTAGFNNFIFYDGYRDILTTFKKYNFDCCFTCLEMAAGDYGSNPPYLVQQIINDCQWAGIDFEGENALEVYDYNSLERIKNWVPKGLKVFTFLRLGDAFMQNWNTIKQFVSDMHNA
ncbi:glycosyl hydrolase [Tritrichomonas foetus]|uniref:Beta-amylase n=1 Tax=Tritrichomonas foetus TaxID=1144522 RepID=A0A1J4KGG8_9EUKA|nr:glycosyl hydrolase [Tritrichomonas foetus]|eukprot:OHT10032.1 glycosyl hydrolase [Tritrichomonas foetus]